MKRARASALPGNYESESRNDTPAVSVAAGNPSARISVKKDAVEYNMNHLQRGKAVIFNHKAFKDTRIRVGNVGTRDRTGTDLDKDNLAEALKNLDFDVETYDDLSKAQLLQKLKQLSADDHTDRDCILVAVFSHGIQNTIHAHDVNYGSNELWDPFTADNCLTLAGKPKIFLIQACQGDQVDSGTVVEPRETVPVIAPDSEVPQRETYTIPNRADFFIIFSTVPGYFSWRNSSQGSWFIQSLCKIFSESGRQKELQMMMTSISRKVALDYKSSCSNPKWHQKKQIPYATSTLTREVYFHPKHSNGECAGRIAAGQICDSQPSSPTPEQQEDPKKRGLKFISYIFNLFKRTSKS